MGEEDAERTDGTCECEEGKQYPAGGSEERARLVEASETPPEKSSRSTGAERSVSFGGVPSVIGAGAADAPMSAGSVFPEFRWYRGPLSALSRKAWGVLFCPDDTFD